MLHRLGFDLVPYKGHYFPTRRRTEILRRLGIDFVVDVGANEGQYALELRREGYRRRIVSFEPGGDAYSVLATRLDPLWTAHQVALGSSVDTQTLHRSGRSWSSSLLPMTERHLSAAPDTAYVDIEEVHVRPLDSYDLDGRIFLKVDTQGFERPVLEGAKRSLANGVLAIELELSPTTLYEGQALMSELVDLVYALGFVFLSVAPAFVEASTGEILQFNGIFGRSDALRDDRASTSARTRSA
jgi:FkbM family methyltransferase